MTIKITLLAGAGAAALAMAGATPAWAKPGFHASAAASQAAEIKELREEVEALKARLDAQESAQLSTESQAQDAATAAATAATAAQSAQTQAAAAAQAVPAEVKTQLASAPKPKGGWWDNTVISGRMYFNASNIDAKTNGLKSAANGTGFNIKRFYLGVDHKFNDMFSANLTMDAANVIGQTANSNFATPSVTLPAVPAGGAASTTVNLNNTGLVGKGFFIKKAYLQAKFSPALIVRAGAADLPWVPYDEGQYGFRHIENTLIDRTGFGTSADWGIHVLGDLFNGIVSYQVSVVDGAGFRNVKVTKSVDVEGRISAQYKGAYAAVGGYTGKLGNNVESTIDPHTARRFNALVGYKNKMFNIAGEYFYAKNYNNNGQNYINSAVLTDKAEGYSVYGNVNFAEKFSAFGRYDWVKPRKDLAPLLRDRYFNVGLQYEPVKIVDLAIVYKRDMARGGTISTTNGTIGGANGAVGFPVGRGTYDEIGLFGQFRF